MVIITISGKPGSGKSTMAKMLAEKYKMKYYSTGDFFRKKAKELGLTLKEFSILTEKSRQYDEETDAWQTNIGKTQDNFVIEGRLSYKFIPQAVKIYLDISKEVGAERIMKEKREGETPLDKAHAIHLWEHRVNSEIKRYEEYYNIDLHDLSQYDFVLDTSSLSKKQVFGKLCEFVDGFLKKK